MARLAFAVKSLQRLLRSQPRSCPYCGSANTTFLQRKKLLLELRRCEDCCLMFRYPKDDPDTSFRFYQEAYEQGVTTDLPKDTALSRLIQTRFAGSEVDLAPNIAIVKRYKQSGRLLDYGCSWGYGVYQFTNSGFEAVGFEISKPRAALARHALKVDVIDSLEGLDRLADAGCGSGHGTTVSVGLLETPCLAARRRASFGHVSASGSSPRPTPMNLGGPFRAAHAFGAPARQSPPVQQSPQQSPRNKACGRSRTGHSAGGVKPSL